MLYESQPPKQSCAPVQGWEGVCSLLCSSEISVSCGVKHPFKLDRLIQAISREVTNGKCGGYLKS